MYTAGRAKGWRKMKKNLLILIVFFITSILFALNSEYFNNTKIDILYVDLIEGLRIRDTPGLTGNRIGVLYDRMVVKVVEIGDEDFQSEIKQDVFQIIDIKENALTLRLNDVEGELVPSFTNRYFLSCLTSDGIKITEFEEPSLKALMYSFTSDMIKEITGGKNYEILFNNLIKIGIPIEDSEYMEKYKQYWEK